MSEEAIVNHYILSHMFGRQRTLRIDWPFESIALDKVLSNTFLRILNPMLVKYFKEISVFTQNINIYSDLIYAKSTFVVSKWSHDITGKIECFLVSERSDFSKNYGIFYSLMFMQKIFLFIGFSIDIHVTEGYSQYTI